MVRRQGEEMGGSLGLPGQGVVLAEDGGCFVQPVRAGVFQGQAALACKRRRWSFIRLL